MSTKRGQALQIAPKHKHHSAKGTKTKVNNGVDAEKRRAVEDHQKRMRERNEWDFDFAA